VPRPSRRSSGSLSLPVDLDTADAGPDLRERYGERVPSVTVDGRPRFEYRVDPDELRAVLWCNAFRTLRDGSGRGARRGRGSTDGSDAPSPQLYVVVSNAGTTAVIHTLLVHSSPETATRIATEVAADPGVSVVTATTVAEVEATLRDSPIDCAVVAVDPTDEAGTALLRSVSDVDPTVPRVLAPAADAEAAGSLVDRIVAAADGTAREPSAAVPLDAVPGLCCLVTSAGEIGRWNERVTDVLGMDAAVAGMDATRLVPPEARERLTRAVDEAIETGRSSLDAPVTTAAGERIDHEWTLTRVGDDRCCLVGLDVSERAAVTAELHDTERSLAALYETLSNRGLNFETRLERILELGCERLDVEHGFLTRITGGTQRVVGACGSHPSLQPDEECPLSEAYCRKTIRGDGLLGVHNAVAAGWEGDPAYDAFGLGCYLGGKVLVDGDLYGTLCFADDDARTATFTDAERTFVELLTRWVSYELEEQAARENLERQNERLSEFASIVSHDLRNPLNVAAGQLEVARETGEMSALDEVEEALHRMEELVTDLLELARQGSVVESVDEVAFGAVVESAWSNVATGDAELVVETDGTIQADRDRLLQLLENLVRNAVEHGATADTDGLTVTASVRDGGFYVADTGPGIPPDRRETVFERGHSTNDGTGLGLPIVEAVADAHGWSTSVAESDAGGARFEFTGVDRPVTA